MAETNSNDKVRQMRDEYTRTGAITCPRCTHYNAILVNFIGRDGVAYQWQCRDCGYEVLESDRDFERYQQEPLLAEADAVRQAEIITRLSNFAPEVKTLTPADYKYATCNGRVVETFTLTNGDKCSIEFVNRRRTVVDYGTQQAYTF